MIDKGKLDAALQEADDAVCKMMRTLPDRKAEFETYEAEIRRHLIVTLGADDDRLEVRTKCDMTVARDGTRRRMVFVMASVDGVGTAVHAGRALREKRKLNRSTTAQQIVDAAPLTITPVLVDGLTPVQCYDRLSRWQNEDSAYRSGGAKLSTILTPAQLVAARQVWSGFLRDKVKQSDHQRREADRLQVVVDFDEYD